MIGKNRLNATDLRHRLAELDKDLRRDLAAAIRADFGMYPGIRRAVALLHIATDGEYGIDPDELPYRLPAFGAAEADDCKLCAVVPAGERCPFHATRAGAT